MMNKLRLLLMLFFGMLLFFGCQKPWTDPEFDVKPWTPPAGGQWQIWTIDNPDQDNRKNVLWRHRDRYGSWNPQPDSITDPKLPILRFLKAVVVSSDEGGNYYKKMVIQDHTGGVELELDMVGLYNTYPVGQKVVIILNGLVVGDYRQLPQIGWIYNNDQVGRINSLYLDNYIIKDGLPSLQNVPKPLTNKEIDFLSPQKDVNKLVRLENVTFEELAIGKPFAFSDILPATDWDVYVPVANGIEDTVTVRTSAFAKFRSNIIEDKTYNLTGILTKFDNKFQFMIRTKEDIEVIK